MGSKGRIPPRRPHPGPGMGHPDPFGPAIRPPSGAFPPFDMLPPSEVMGQKLHAQHMEMQKLVIENQRLASTHGSLRQELAAAQHELQMVHGHIGEMNAESEQQKRALMDKMARMEADLQAGQSINTELQQARAEAQKLSSARLELLSRVQKLDLDLQRSHTDLQQIPIMLSELDGLRQEYQHCRATFDYEKKLSNDHVESLQVMEKNYVAMAREVEKLRSELTNSSKLDRTGGHYGGNPRYGEGDASKNHPVGQNAYGHGYGVTQGKVEGGISLAVDPAVSAAGGVAGGTTPIGAHSGSGNTPVNQRIAYDAARGPAFDTQLGPSSAAGYSMHRGIGGPGYDAHRGAPVPVYDSRARATYEGHGTSFSGHAAPQYDPQRGSGYDISRGGYDQTNSVGYNPSAGASASQGQGATVKVPPYASGVPPARGAGAGYGAPPRQGGNAAKR